MKRFGRPKITSAAGTKHTTQGVQGVNDRNEQRLRQGPATEQVVEALGLPLQSEHYLPQSALQHGCLFKHRFLQRKGIS